MARIWQSGWETNSAAASSGEWNLLINGSGAATFDTAVVRSGTYAGKCVGDNAGFRTAIGLNLSTSVTRVYVRLSAIPTTEASIWQFRNSSDVSLYDLILTTSGTLYLFNRTTSAADVTGTTVLAVDTWYRIEVKLVISATVGASQLWIDGVSEGSASGLNTGTVNVDRVLLSTGEGGDSFTLFLDDAAIDDANQPGAGSIIQLAPNGDGTLGSWTSDGASPHFDSGDDWPGAADDDTTYLYAPNKTDATANYDLTATPATFDATAVNAIMTLVRARKEESVGSTFPTVQARTETSLGAGTSLTINFTQTTGHLVVIFLGLNDTAQVLSTVGDGFTDLTAANATFHILYKELAGTEGGNVVVTVGTSTKGAAIAYNITGHVAPGTQAPEFSTVATGTSTAPDPGSISPTGGSKDYLFLAAFRQNGEEADDDTWCNSAPTSYTNLTQSTSGTAGVASTNGSVASAERQNTTATENPATFDTDQSLAWRAYTVAIHPAAAVTDTVDLYTQLRRSDESTAITNELTVVTTAPTSYTSYLKLMTPTGSHTKAQWDAARLAIRQDYTQNGGADTTARLRVTAVALSVDYVPGAAPAGWGPLLGQQRSRLVRAA